MVDPATAEFQYVVCVTIRVVLASGSPRRTLLLAAAGIPHRVAVPDVDESLMGDEDPSAYVLRLSGAKAAAVTVGEDEVAIGADTTVTQAGSVIGKPVDAEDALSILRSLQGASHRVLTGWTVRSVDAERFGVTESLVRFHARTDDELRAYIERTRPFDKAGAYALQGDGGWLVRDVEGSRSNVMGLPIADVIDALADFGIERSAPHGG